MKHDTPPPRFRTSTHPGVILLEEFLKPWGMSLRQASKRMKITLPYVKLLVAGKRSVSMRMAGLLERLTKMPKETWISLQRAHDLSAHPERHMGGNFDDWLKEEGIFERVKARSGKRVKSFSKKTVMALPIIRTKDDLMAAIARLDVIIDAPDGSPEAHERTALSDLVGDYEDRHVRMRRPIGFYEQKAKKRGLQSLVDAVEIPPIAAKNATSSLVPNQPNLHADARAVRKRP